MSANQYYGGGPSGGPQYPQQAQYQGPPGQGDKGMFNHGQQQYQQPGGYGMQQPMQYGPPGGRESDIAMLRHFGDLVADGFLLSYTSHDPPFPFRHYLLMFSRTRQPVLLSPHVSSDLSTGLESTEYGGYPNQGYPQQQPVFVQQGPPPKSGGGGGCCAACCGVLAGL